MHIKNVEDVNDYEVIDANRNMQYLGRGFNSLNYEKLPGMV